jgi:hypothetical protein
MKLLSAAVVVALLSTAASANSRSWTAVKNTLPDHVEVVAGANLAALRGTSLYGSIIPQLLAKEPDARKAIDLAKATCAIDLHAAVRDVTFAVGDDQRGVIVLALDKSIDQKRVVDCATKIAASQHAPSTTASADVATTTPAKGGLKAGAKKPPVAAKTPPPAATPRAPKIVAKPAGKLTEYSLDNDPSARVYVAWLALDVVAFATDPDDKALLDKMLGGKGAKGTLASYLVKARPSAAIWLASTKAQTVQAGVNMKGAFGTIDATKGNVAVDMNLVLASAKEAKDFVDQATALIASMKSSIPPQFQKLVDSLKLTAAADAANVKLTATEKDIASVIALAMMNL